MSTCQISVKLRHSNKLNLLHEVLLYEKELYEMIIRLRRLN